MQPTHSSRRILLPARPWFIYLSLVVALALLYIPTGHFPLPDWVALVLIFWCIREPRRVGMFTGFVLGLLVDIGLGAAMGQHALAYVVLAFIANALSRRALWFGTLGQTVQVLPMLLIAQVIMLVVRLIAGAEFPGWTYFLSSITAAMIWGPVSMLLLLPQFQPTERDDNRPI